MSPETARPRWMRFPVTIFLSAFLLFQVQPMMGRYVLPWFGGGPAVWTNCLLFFQTVLLAGYAYAHWLGSRPSTRVQGSVHIALLAASLLFLPIGPRAASWKPASSGDPSGHILLLLAVTAGGPYLLLSACHRAAPAALVYVQRAGKIAVAALRAVELWIVSGAAQLSVRHRALPAPERAGVDLVGPVPRVRGPLRMDRMAASRWHRHSCPWWHRHSCLCSWHTRYRTRLWNGAVLVGSLGVRLHAAAGHHQPDLPGDCGESVPVGGAAFHLPVDLHLRV
ncbi:membrane hypothetical protein [Candidatus Sulfopaludibacter sp. SbA4]|nr:membrane hypothetical protein [Candidatus Sulfopaludibacter sp. SbA4]